MSAPLISCNELVAGYGSLAVVRGLNLEVNEGEVVALIGANGAGKSTTLLTLAGAQPALGGQVLWKGKPTTAALHQRCNQGLGYLTEERSVIMGMSTAENLRLAGVPYDKAVELFPALAELMDRRAGLLSGGEQQMLSLARALGRNPQALLADELSLGLAPLIVDHLLGVVRAAANERGVGVLLVEQHVRKALKYADRVYVMVRGSIVMSATAQEAMKNLADIESAYLSTSAT